MSWQRCCPVCDGARGHAVEVAHVNNCGAQGAGGGTALVFTSVVMAHPLSGFRSRTMPGHRATATSAVTVPHSRFRAYRQGAFHHRLSLHGRKSRHSQNTPDGGVLPRSRRAGHGNKIKRFRLIVPRVRDWKIQPSLQRLPILHTCVDIKHGTGCAPPLVDFIVEQGMSR